MLKAIPTSLVLLLAVLCFLPSAEAAERFPKPNPQRAFASVKVYDSEGSPLRVPKEDWAGARQRVASSPKWKNWVEGRRKDLDAWMAEPRDRVEYVAGWWHDFVDPSNGAFLQWTLQPPANATPKVFGGWVYGLRYRNIQHILEAARMWRLTGEERYFAWAVKQLDFYAAHYQDWPLQTQRSTARLMHQSLDDATSLVTFINAARLLDGEVPEAYRTGYPARRQQWIDRLFLPMAALLDESFRRVHNIACWQRTAQALAAIYTADEKLWQRAIDGEFGVRQQIREGITSDYFWLEQSLAYNSYVVSALLPLFEMAALSGRLDGLRDEASVVQNLMLSSLAIRFPDNRVPTPADTTGIQRKVPEKAMLASARRVFPTTIGIQEARNYDWGNLIDPVEADAANQPVVLPEVKTHSFESSRFALLRKDNWQVFFHYGQLDRSHAQAEALSYEAYYGDIDVTHDAGTVGYGSPLHREYYTTAWAHNVPLIDGKGQEGWDAGELLSFDATSAKVAARQPLYRPDAIAERSLSIEDGTLVETTKIVAKDGNSHRLGLVLNIQGAVSVPASAIRQPDPPFAHWSNASTWDVPAEAAFQGSIRGKRFLLEVKAPAAMHVIQATVPDAPPDKRQALYLEIEGREAEFQVRWRPE
jgi:hypothetical protein